MIVVHCVRCTILRCATHLLVFLQELCSILSYPHSTQNTVRGLEPASTMVLCLIPTLNLPTIVVFD